MHLDFQPHPKCSQWKGLCQEVILVEGKLKKKRLRSNELHKNWAPKHLIGNSQQKAPNIQRIRRRALYVLQQA